MKKKIFSFALLAGLLGISSLLGLSKVETAPVDAANENAWSIAGSMNGWNTSAAGYDMVYSNDDSSGNPVYKITLALKTGDEFKIVKNHAWGGDIGWSDYSTDQGKSTYLQNSGGNFKLKATGNFTISFTDKTVKTPSHGPWAGDVAIEEATTVEYVTLTFLKKDGSTLATEEVLKDSTFSPKFFEEEGYALEGWYSDSTFTTKVNKGEAVTTDLTLYPKYVEVEDYVIWVRDIAGGFGKNVNVYMWCDAFDGHTNQAWPGVALTEVSTDLYMIEVDASKCYDRFIINDATHQTVDVSFTSTSHNFFGISNAKVDGKNTCSALYHNASTLSSYVLSDDTEGTCQNKFEGAKLLYLDLSEEEQTAFKTDATYADAHARYVAWATALGLDPYTGTSATRSYFFTNDNTSNVAVILVMVTCLSIVGLIAVKSVRKARKED